MKKFRSQIRTAQRLPVERSHRKEASRDETSMRNKSLSKP
jgi:hypothetical protein